MRSSNSEYKIVINFDFGAFLVVIIIGKVVIPALGSREGQCFKHICFSASNLWCTCTESFGAILIHRRYLPNSFGNTFQLNR